MIHLIQAVLSREMISEFQERFIAWSPSHGGFVTQVVRGWKA